jgi:hypothetical protein
LKHILLVLSNAVEGTDDTFNAWYNGTHLPDVLKVRGFSAAQRFALSETQMADGERPYKYIAVYEVDDDDLPAVREALGSAAGGTGMYIDPSLDRSRTVAFFYTPVTERVTG